MRLFVSQQDDSRKKLQLGIRIFVLKKAESYLFLFVA